MYLEPRHLASETPTASPGCLPRRLVHRPRPDSGASTCQGYHACRFSRYVEGVARAGEVKNVADGFARNFLLPRKLASAATTAEVKRAETPAHRIQAEKQGRRRRPVFADKLNEPVVKISARVGEQGRG